MYAKNIATFLLNMVKNGQLNLNLEDEIVRDTLVTRDGKIANPRVAEILGIAIEAPATNG
jgi:NAD(P) transhydrogenase subunit alpha